MFEVQTLFKSLRRALLAAFLVGLVWLVAMPAPAQAAFGLGAQEENGNINPSKSTGRIINGQPSDQLKQTGEATSRQLDKTLSQDHARRPKTTGEWQREADQNASLGTRAKQITEESAEAFKQFGNVYPDTADRSGRDLND